MKIGLLFFLSFVLSICYLVLFIPFINNFMIYGIFDWFMVPVLLVIGISAFVLSEIAMTEYGMVDEVIENE